LFEKAEKAVQEAFGSEDSEERETLNTPRLLQVAGDDSETSGDDDSGSGRKNIPGPRPQAKKGVVSGRCDRECVSTDVAEPSDFPDCRSSREWDSTAAWDQHGTRAKLYVFPG